MEITEILSKCDHTLLDRRATQSDIAALIDDGIKFGTASVCIPPCFVGFASKYASNRIPVCTVIGFPNGYNSTSVKLFEAKQAIEDGADEIDAVINVGMLKAKNYDYVLSEISALKEVCGDRILKIIIETCLLTEEEKIIMCSLVGKGGADYIKTSTGFSDGGAKREDIVLMRAHLAENVKIKAAGGIRTLGDAEDFIKLGADRLGTSAIVKAVKAMEEK